MDTLLCNDDGDIIFFGAPSATDEILAFHYGNFDNAYGDGTVADAAANGRVYANTDPGTLPEEFGSIGTPSTASGQTTYTWTPPVTSLQANVLVVAGGGGGGGNRGGGGGAGGLKQINSTIAYTTHTIKVGAGASTPPIAGSANSSGRNGSNSSFNDEISTGGGGGAWANVNGNDGGSGGGAGHYTGGVNYVGGSGIEGEGNDGGDRPTNIVDGNSKGSGGGGAGTVGETFNADRAGNGGTGFLVNVFGEIYGESGWFAGGGGGGAGTTTTSPNAVAGTGGLGGGGNGGAFQNVGSNGRAHTGGGGGGGSEQRYGGLGGSGIVAIRYIVDTTVIVSNYVVNRSLAVLLDAADTASYSGTGTTWTDISGNGRNGTLQGSVSWVDQGSASYFDFSGANADYINQTAGTTQIYKDMCIVFQHEDGDWNYLLSKSTTVDRSLRINGNSIGNPGNTGDWAQTATTYYVNGVADTNAVALSQNQWYILGGENKNATLLGSAWGYYLGTGYTQGNRNLNGKIAFLALYTEPLTAAEHIHNYNALKHRFGV